jgi:hypothetical protein
VSRWALHSAPNRAKLKYMKRFGVFRISGLSLGCGLLIFLMGRCDVVAQVPSQAASGFNAAAAEIEARLAQQHRAQNSFLSSTGESQQSQLLLHPGEPTIEHLGTSAGGASPGALLHHWRGTAFIPGGKAADFERLLKDFQSYPQLFSPQVARAKVLAQHGDNLEVSLRVRQKHVITVVMDTTYDVTFGRLDAMDGYSASKSVSITEIHSPGTNEERPMTSREEHGFLWRMNTYWTYEEHDNGIYIQIESLSLSRSVPFGLGWVIQPYVESVPRESLEFTLRAACNAMRRSPNGKAVSP